MKFYCAGKFLYIIEQQEYELLMGANIECASLYWDDRRVCGRITKEIYGRGWIFEADESFQSWCVVAYKFNPIVIYENEYQQLLTSGVTYVGKERTEKLKQMVKAQLEPMTINS